MFLFCYALRCGHSSFAIILKRKRNLDVLLLLSYICLVTVNVLCHFLTFPWVGLQCVVVVFPDHTHLLFYKVFVYRYFDFVTNLFLSQLNLSLI